MVSLREQIQSDRILESPHCCGAVPAMSMERVEQFPCKVIKSPEAILALRGDWGKLPGARRAHTHRNSLPIDPAEKLLCALLALAISSDEVVGAATRE